MFEKSFKILNFGLHGTHPKCTVLVHFEAQFTVVKPKILPKTKISAKTEPLGIINNVSTNSQKNHIILVKLSQKEIFGPKLGLTCPHGAVPNAHHKFSYSL